MKNLRHIVVSRTDSIGDVILTLPLCFWLKKEFPQVKISFLGRSYTQEVLKCYPFIDEVLCWDELEKKSEIQQIQFFKTAEIDTFIHVFPRKELAKLIKKANIPNRIGTSHRLYHWTTCNIRPNFTRKKSDFHESQLNFELLRPLGIKNLPTLKEIGNMMAEFSAQQSLPSFLEMVLETERKKIILHTKSQGSAVEWPLKKYIELAKKLSEKGFIIYFSGTEKEGQLFRSQLPKDKNIIDISGKSTLGELITFIAQCDALVACSTGPLHLAAVVGIHAIGLYTDLRPMHPGRWQPIGKNVTVLTHVTKNPPQLEDINAIAVDDVLQSIIH